MSQLPDLPAEFGDLLLDAPPEAVALLAALQQLPLLGKSFVGADEVTEFLDGMRPIFHRVIDATMVPEPDGPDVAAAVAEFANYIESWSLTARLGANSEWIRQMEEEFDLSDKPVTIDELHRRLVG